MNHSQRDLDSTVKIVVLSDVVTCGLSAGDRELPLLKSSSRANGSVKPLNHLRAWIVH